MKYAKTEPASKKPAPTIYEQAPEIKPGQSIELLKELHILTRDGKLNQDSRRKLKQVYHLVQFIEPLLKDVLADHPGVTLEGFDDDPKRGGEKILEAIQQAWIDEA